MPITIHADMALKTSQNYVGSITEYSTETLVLLLPQEVVAETLAFSWISPSNLRFAERQLFRDLERDIVDGDTTSEYAYSATIYPAMTAGIQAQQTSGKSVFAFRKGTTFSPIIKINVDKSIIPEQSEIPPTVADELQIQINELFDIVGATQPFDRVELDTVNPAADIPIGATRWSADSHTMQTRLSNDVYLEHGQETHFPQPVKALEDIADMDVVEYAGVLGGQTLVRKARAVNVVQNTKIIIGIATQSILQDQWGVVTWYGLINNIATGTWEEGDILWYNPAVDGGLTNEEPAAPNPRVMMAIVKRASSTPSSANGALMVRPEFGSYLRELHDLHIPNLQVGDTIRNTGTRFETYNIDALEDRVEAIEQVTQPAEDDLRFPATLLRQGANTKPDFDFTNIGLLFPQNDTTEAIYIIAQMPHDRKANSNIEPHIHCRLAGAGQPVFKMQYKWFNPTQEAIPGSFTEYVMNVNTATWSSGTISNMIYGANPISGVGKGVSSIMIIKLYRDDNVYTGDLLVDEFDIHYIKDRFGEGIL